MFVCVCVSNAGVYLNVARLILSAFRSFAMGRKTRGLPCTGLNVSESECMHARVCVTRIE